MAGDREKWLGRARTAGTSTRSRTPPWFPASARSSTHVGSDSVRPTSSEDPSAPIRGCSLAAEDGRRARVAPLLPLVGRLVDHKGTDVLAAAYQRYRGLVDDPWDLEVVGIGPLEHLLRGSPGVTLHGFRAPEDVAELMRRVGCFVLPSHIEPYGAVVHEAAASGLPLLCTDFAGAASGLVQDGANGWLVPSGDVERWTEAMVRMSALPAERLVEMSEVSRALATRLSPEGWARHLTEELERRMEAGGGRLSR